MSWVNSEMYAERIVVSEDEELPTLQHEAKVADHDVNNQQLPVQGPVPSLGR